MENQINGITLVEYKGMNQEVLKEVAAKNHYTSSLWFTFLQARKINRKVKKGEKGTHLTKYMEVEKIIKGKAQKKIIPKHFVVFHCEQTEESTPKCKGCGEETGSYPALSRYGHGDICSNCGTKEAFEGNFILDKQNN